MKEREKHEAGHFDCFYDERRDDGCAPVSEINLRRYRQCRDADLYGAERLFALAHPVTGRDVLEMGCGLGKNAICLAANGARVFAYDISSVGVETARKRAELNGLADRIEFAVGTTPQECFPGRTFDVVFGNLILHHLDFDCFDTLLPPLLKPGGKCVFREPVVRSRVLGMLRKLVPWYPSNPTPDERPLADYDITRLATPFAKCEVYYYEALSRLWGRVKGNARLIRELHEFDARAFRMFPWTRLLASCAVFRLSGLRVCTDEFAERGVHA